MKDVCIRMRPKDFEKHLSVLKTISDTKHQKDVQHNQDKLLIQKPIFDKLYDNRPDIIDLIVTLSRKARRARFKSRNKEKRKIKKKKSYLW